MADVHNGNIVRMSRRQILLRVALAVVATLSLRSGPTEDLAMAVQAPNGPPTMVRMSWLRKPPSILSPINPAQDNGPLVNTFKVGFEPQETLEDLKKAVHARTKIPMDEIDVYVGFDIQEKDGATIQSVAEKELKRRGISEEHAGLPWLFVTDRRLDLEGADSFDIKRYQEKKGAPMDWAQWGFDRDTSAEKAKWDAKEWPARGESLKPDKKK